MRHRFRFAQIGLILAALSLSWSLVMAQETTPEVTQEVSTDQNPVAAATVASTAAPTQAVSAQQTYTVRPGETLFRIAIRFNTTVSALAAANGITNPSLIYAGQTLKIPGTQSGTPTPVPTALPTSAPTATPVPGSTSSYTVVRGDTLFRIAVRFNTTISQLVSLNNLANANIIYIGQTLKIPVAGSTPATTVPPAATAGVATVQPVAPEVTQAVSGDQGGGEVQGYGFSYGVEAFLVDQNVIEITGQITSLGVTWVKQVINWRDFEPVQGQIDFDTLDTIVNSMHDAGLNILLTVTAAPAWARSTADENGPPDNFGDYVTFVTALAQRYTSKVQAYEVWNEPNLRREWNSKVHVIGPTSYSELLKAAYPAIKAADPSALVLSAGLAPTGFNDGVNAINDRQFLKDLYTVGLADVSDAIGAHPLGWANPPDSVCCEAPVGVETHFEDPSFFFRNTLNDYRQIMVTSQDGNTPVWVTKFGWGTSEDTDAPSENNVFLTYTTLGEQAIYDPRGFELGAEFGFIGPMFLDNLNGCQAGSAENCYYALFGPDGASRPVYAAVQVLINPALAPQDTEPTAELPAIEPATVEPTAEAPAAPTEEQPAPEETTSP